MTNEERIDYMIQTLQVAKDEIAYYKAFESEPKGEYGTYSSTSYDRQPNGTIIREALRSVGRMAFLVANEVGLSPYCHGLFKKN